MRLEEILNDLAMQLVMVDDASFEQSKSDFQNLLKKVAELSKAEDKSEELRVSCAFVASEILAKKTQEAITLLKQFSSAAQTYLTNPSHATLPGLADTSGLHEDLSPSLDRELLVEFIEKHSGLMDEFENSISELRLALEETTDEASKEELRKDFDGFSKAYIHTVKGDAGSIGLIGVERVCHFIEDIIVESRAAALLDTLIMFKEWVCRSMSELAKGKDPSITATSVKLEIKESAQAEGQLSATAPNVVLTAAQSESKASVEALLGEDVPVGANFDLLAELLADGIGDSPAPTPEQEDQVKEPVKAVEPQPSSSDNQIQFKSEEYEISGERDVFAEFIVEAEDHLNIIESILLEVGGNCTTEHIGSLFRGIHSIKGASSYFTLKDTMETSHVTESLLDEVRSKKRAFDQPLADLVLNYVTLQQKLFTKAREGVQGNGKMHRIPEAAQYLKRLSDYQNGVVSNKNDTVPQQVVEEVKASTPVKDVTTASKGETEDKGAVKNEKLEVKNFVKVDTQRLDLLVDSIGEMCIYSSMLINRCRELCGEDEKISRVAHQVEKFSRELQGIGMSMRLIPIRGLFQKMSRLVWDTSKKIKKDIKFVMHGEDTELDRTIIDKLADPLMHMIRNALDHGVETPDERVESGKSRQGTITLSAAHASGSIHITIVDDGRGLDPEKLVKKAVEKGIISEQHNLTRQEIFQLIFAAGFSTAAKVTDISGRGVGMDVVKRNIESLRGRVLIESEVGKGAKFTIQLPLTLAIMDGIEVGVGNESFLVPTLSVIEFMKPHPGQLTRTLEKGETFHFRGKYLPIYRLGELYDIADAIQEPSEAVLIVVESTGEYAAIMVDQIIGSQSAVLKNLGEMFEQGKGLSGCSIMASGDVALILDVRSLLDLARTDYSFTKEDENHAAEQVVQ